MTTFEIRNPVTQEVLAELDEGLAETFSRLQNDIPNTVIIPKSVLTPLMMATTCHSVIFWSVGVTEDEAFRFRPEGDTLISIEKMLGEEFKDQFSSLWVLQFLDTEPAKAVKRKVTQMLGYALPGYEEKTEEMEEDPQAMD
jgi:hypothetical protein